jgi:LacI family transcriptional regulator
MTIKDIAKACGVSMNTVSRAINDRPDINAKTKEKILNYIKEVGFVPNYHAKGMSSDKRFLIGLIYNASFQTWNFKTIAAILEYAQKQGYGTVCQTVIESKDRRLDECRKLLDNLSIYNPEGLIVDASVIRGYESKLAELAQKRDTPLTLINADSKFKDCNSIIKNTEEASRLSTLHLLDKGCEAVLYVGWAQSSGEINFRGYLKALSERNISFDKSLIADTYDLDEKKSKIDMIEKSVSNLKNKHKKIGVYGTTQLLAGIAQRGALKAGMQIPGEIEFLGLEEEEMNDALPYPAISCKSNVSEIARKAVDFTINTRRTGKSQSYNGKWEIS